MSYTDFRIHEIRVGQIHRRPTRPKIRVGLVLHVLHGSGAYGTGAPAHLRVGVILTAKTFHWA